MKEQLQMKNHTTEMISEGRHLKWNKIVNRQEDYTEGISGFGSINKVG